LILNAPVIGINWSYLNAQGQLLPLPPCEEPDLLIMSEATGQTSPRSCIAPQKPGPKPKAEQK
ncbi:MAG: hypothetical protein ACUVQ2_09155, partial [Dissulfurimicrobium sp.]|uniref:hypothetical protein n=1 Tax=Dissulfurimicrobium sp. TaxID=2022436 RepID=UPI004049FAEF